MPADPGPVDERFREKLNGLARAIDKGFNPQFPSRPKTVGFVVLLFEFGEDPKGRCNYISNAEREDVIKLLREQADYFEEDLKARKEHDQPKP